MDLPDTTITLHRPIIVVGVQSDQLKRKHYGKKSNDDIGIP